MKSRSVITICITTLIVLGACVALYFLAKGGAGSDYQKAKLIDNGGIMEKNKESGSQFCLLPAVELMGNAGGNTPGERETRYSAYTEKLRCQGGNQYGWDE